MANKRQREEKRRSARRLTEQKRSTNQVIDDGMDDDLPVEEVEEVVSKEYYGGYSAPIPGPTSWEEHESMKMAREMAEKVREVSWTTQDLVSNILYANMTPEQKSKAIQAVGDGFGKKLAKEQKEEKMEKSLGVDLLQLEAIIARDARQMGFVDKTVSWISKFKSPDAEVKDKASMRNALRSALEDAKNGKEIDVQALITKSKEFGIGSSESGSSAVVVEKDKTGQWRAVMWPSNNFIDWDGDIISEVAHKEYVEWVNENMDYAPVFMSWHKPETTRKSRVDFVGYDNGFLLMSAPLTESEAAGLLRAQAMTDMGMSHGTIVLERDPDDERVITKYRMVEVSDLPLSKAANPFTDFETLVKEADMPNMDTKAYLASILGSEDEAEKFIVKSGIKQKALQDAGIESKEKKEETPASTQAVTPAVEKVDVESVASQVFERIAKELDIEGLNDYLKGLKESTDKVSVLEALVKDMKTSKEDDLAEMIKAPAAKSMVWQKARASQSEENVIDPSKKEDEKLQKAKPELGWLSEATGTTPVEA